MNSVYRILPVSLWAGSTGKTLFRTHHNRWEFRVLNPRGSLLVTQVTLCTFCKWGLYLLLLLDRDPIPSSSSYLEAGTSFDYWSTKKRHNNLPTLLPSLRQHPSPFRQAGEFIRTKFWKIFEVKAKEEGACIILAGSVWSMIIGLLFTRHKFWA